MNSFASPFRRRLMLAYRAPLPNYLRFTAREASTITRNSGYTSSLEYSVDGKVWNTFDSSTTISLSVGETVYFKGSNQTLASSDSNYTQFVMTGSIEASGNIMSLLYGDNFDGKLTMPKNNTFNSLFKDCTALRTPPELPATSFKAACYKSMFMGCSNLLVAPVLPAINVNGGGYEYTNMFYGCTSIVAAPELPATTLSYGCYSHMFEGCSSMTTPPALPAVKAEGECYSSMFKGCTSLVTCPTIFATSVSYASFRSMFENCRAMTSVPALPSTTLANYCYYGMFKNCASITNAPELPAATLVNNCYSQMFYNCAKIDYIKMLATYISATGSLSNWLYGVSSTGTFVKSASMTTLPSGASGIPNGWDVQDAS